MKTQFTPGEWKYNEDANTIWSDIEMEDNNPIICDLSEHFKRAAENLANARLIAAAPKLYAALIHLLSQVEAAPDAEYYNVTTAYQALTAADGIQRTITTHS